MTFNWKEESERLRMEYAPNAQPMTREPILLQMCREHYEKQIDELISMLEKYEMHSELTEKIKQNIEELGTVNILKVEKDDI